VRHVAGVGEGDHRSGLAALDHVAGGRRDPVDVAEVPLVAGLDDAAPTLGEGPRDARRDQPVALPVGGVQ